ncbi:phage portal protein [Hyphomicrobium sp.]|uniref:phage portal protein n=1 Tax=Hyphomicrobium sp. TaxID=82 RepID=UPI003F72098A
MPRILETLAGLWPRPATPAAVSHAAVAEQVKASATGPLILLETLGRPVWTPRDYEAFAREGFMQNAIVYRSVRMIAEAAASVPLLLYERDDEHEHHPLLDLIARPSLDQTGADFLEAWYGYLLVAGNAYVEAVALDGRIRELHALRPDRMKVVPGAEGWPEAYEYTCAGRTIRFEEEPAPGVRPILHVRLFHPANDHYGMSPIEAAAQAIDIHNTAGRWNKALLDNSARPSGALVYGGADGRMTPEQFERLKVELEEGFQGPRRAGRPLLLEGGLDWKPLSLSPKDMDFIEARNGAAREIALAFGVPPMLLGIPGDNTFSNYQEAQRAFWRSTVLPLVTRTARALSSWLGPAYASSLDLRPDLDRIEALTSEREALWARIEKVSFLTLNEKRAAVGYTPLEEPPPAATEGDASIVVRKYRVLPEASKYRSDQARAPAGSSDGGEWVDEGRGGGSGGRATGGSGRSSKPVRVARAEGETRTDADEGLFSGDEPVQVAQARRPLGPARTINVRGRNYTLHESLAGEVESALRRVDEAQKRARELDPDWKPLPSARSTEPSADIHGVIRGLRMEAQEAEARITVLQRGIPHGFVSHREFQDFGRTAWDRLSAAGHRDAEPFIEGSAVTGYKYTTGEVFDSKRTSDFDLAIVSPSLLRRARDAGVELRSGGTRTKSIEPEKLGELGLEDFASELRRKAGRKIGVMIYDSRESLRRHSPYMDLP